MHGRTSQITHDGRGIFQAASNPLTVCRYHSLVVDETSLPGELEITARADHGEIMGIAHRHLPIVGLQFHPEAIMTDQGYLLLENFLRLAGLKTGPRPIEPEWRPPQLAEPPTARSPFNCSIAIVPSTPGIVRVR